MLYIILITGNESLTTVCHIRSMKMIIALLAATLATAAAQDSRTFVPRMTTLAGSGLHAAQGLHTAAGLESPSLRGGRGPIVRRPMTEEEWRAIFPKRPGGR